MSMDIVDLTAEIIHQDVVHQDLQDAESDHDVPMEGSAPADDEFNFDDIEDPFAQDANADSDEDDDAFWQQTDSTVREKWNALHMKSQLRKARLEMAAHLLNRHIDNITEKKRLIRDQNVEIKQLTEKVAHLTRRRGLHTEVTWPSQLRLFVLGEFELLPFGLRSYEGIYKLSCLESNIAPHPRQLLPGLELVAPDSTELPVAQPVQPVHVLQRFDFERLSLTVQFKILQHVLCFDNQRVHVLSRLDPYHPPDVEDDAEEDDDFSPSLLHRFHVGNEPVSLTNGTMPNVLLAPLLVCKKFHFWGASIFYGENRFAFSSLGE
ncbi:hypothetical protein E4U55_001067 [Claviceps digitariae]|nr:hypothetical protein E4U55_001067 [Claviceps digitariae]